MTCRENGAGERTKANAHEKNNCLAAVEREPLEEGEGGLAAEWAWDERGRRGARAQRPQAAPPPQQQRRCERRTRHAQNSRPSYSIDGGSFNFFGAPLFFRMTQPGFDVSGHRPGDGSAQGAALDVPPGYSPVRSQSLCTKGVHRLHRHHSSSAAASGGRAILKGAADLLLASTGGVLFFSADQRTLQESGPAARRSAVEAAGAGAVESRGDGSRGPADPPRRAL